MDQVPLILGVNHNSAPVEIRERLAFTDAEIAPALSQLSQHAPSVIESVLLCTCNRVEMVLVTTNPSAAAGEAMRFLAANRQAEHSLFTDVSYQLEGREAVRHLLRVSASLDSMVIGEPQILGQVKTAYALAAEAGAVGLVLHRMFHKAFAVAKRVRKETLIGHGAVSVSSAAVGLAQQIFDSLADKTVMLMGAGKMAELTARHLKGHGVRSLIITNRTFDRAAALARELGGTAVSLDDYRPYLKIADVVIGSIATAKPVLGPEEFESVVRERRYRPVFLIDLGVPRNFDERLNAMENVYLYDVDDLGAVARESHSGRQREAVKAEEIVEQESDSFCRWLAGLDLVPTIREIRSSMEELRNIELHRHQGWLNGLEPGQRAHVEQLTRGLVNKLFHRVLSGLRRDDSSPAGAARAAEVARALLVGELMSEGPEGLFDDDDD